MKKNKSIAKKSIALCLSLAMLATAIPATFLTAGAEHLTTPQFGNYYVSDYDTAEEALEASKATAQEMHEEGIILLKNQNKALPLAEGAKISVLGKNSNNLINTVWGSGAGTHEGEEVNWKEAFADEGFVVNPKLVQFYADNSLSGSGRGTPPGNGGVTSGISTGETPVANYTQEVKDSFAEYSDAAFVVISRTGSEGVDLPRTMQWNGSNYQSYGTQTVPGARSGDDHYLQLDQNEADLIKMAGDNFDKVIILFNTGTTFECGFLDDPGHYAYHENVVGALWMGYPGRTAIRALPRILKGEVNPSGHTVDNWSRDFKADPSWQNFGNQRVDGRTSTGHTYSNLGAQFIVYQEGIYNGYRYYETRGKDEGTGSWTGVESQTGNEPIHGSTTTTWDNWYKAHVVFPFGHGLSYTTFTQEIIDQSITEGSSLREQDTVELTVRVRNTGEVAGKEVVQLYYTSPYTSGGIEKSHVVLGNFEKTGIIQPGEYEDVTISVKVREMASYDYSDANQNGFKGYELDAGTYEIKIMKNAHDVLDSVTYNIASTIKCSTDGTTGNEVVNRFDDVSNYLTDSLGKEYMSRRDFQGTFPQKLINITATDAVKTEHARTHKPTDYSDIDTPDSPWYNDTPIVTETIPEGGKILLKDLNGKDYDDPMWDDFLNQLSVSQLKGLVCDGNYASGKNYSEFGIKRFPNENGAGGVYWSSGGEWGKVAWSGKFATYGSETVTATTWNKDLAYRRGKACGNEMLWAGIVGFYSPAVNNHRTPFGGRNYEYFSEDGTLGGIMASYQVRGVQECGVYPYVKHFGINDQETNRCGLHSWVNEQTMREITFKPFEICVKEGKTLAIMSALSDVGATWSGGNWNLLTGLLRKEWGFNGNVVTDSYSASWGPADIMIRGGGNMALGIAGLSYQPNSNTTLNCVREMAHGLLYAHANSMAINEGDVPTTPPPIQEFNATELSIGMVGLEYTANIATATINSLVAPNATNSDIRYSVAEGSVLPRGLTLSQDGVISGKPRATVNNYKFVINASYGDCVKSAEFTMSIADANGSILYDAKKDLGSVQLNKPCDLSVGGAYIFKPNAAAGEVFPEIKYSLANGSLLPQGLTLSQDGKITGTPTNRVSNYKFSVTASAFGFIDVTEEFTLNVFYASSVDAETKTLAAGKHGLGYLDTVNFVTSDEAVKYSLKAGSTLPVGLKLTEGGYIVGTPVQAVTNHVFTVVASGDYIETVEREYQITIGIRYALTDLEAAKVGKEYDAVVNFAQGAGDVTYTAENLPEGLEISPDGTITGKPKKAGKYEVTLTASSEGLQGDSVTLTLYVEGSVVPMELIIGVAGGGGALILISFAFLARKKKGVPGKKQ